MHKIFNIRVKKNFLRKNNIRFRKNKIILDPVLEIFNYYLINKYNLL